MDFSALRLSDALSLLRQTMPILLIRLGMMLLFWLVAFIYLMVFGTLATFMGSVIGWVGFIIFIMILIPIIPAYRIAYRRFFYPIKTAHIAIMVAVLEGESIELLEGRALLEWGQKKVKKRYKSRKALTLIDAIVRKLVNKFTLTVASPIVPPSDIHPMLASAIERVNTAIVDGINFIDEAVMARSFFENEETIWANARDGIILYAMQWQAMTPKLLSIRVLTYIPAIIIFILFFVPIGFFVGLLNGSLSGATFIFVLLFAWFVNVAVGDAIAQASAILNFRDDTADVEPDPQVSAQLDTVDVDFRKLKRQALKVATG